MKKAPKENPQKKIGIDTDSIIYLYMLATMAAISSWTIHDYINQTHKKISSVAFPSFNSGTEFPGSLNEDNPNNQDPSSQNNTNTSPEEILPPMDLKTLNETLQKKGIELKFSNLEIDKQATDTIDFKAQTQKTDEIKSSLNDFWNVPPEIQKELNKLKTDTLSSLDNGKSVNFSEVIMDYFSIVNGLNNKTKQEKLQILEKKKNTLKPHTKNPLQLLFELKHSEGRYKASNPDPFSILDQKDPNGNCQAKIFYNMLMLESLGIKTENIFIQEFNNSVTTDGIILGIGHVRTIVKIDEEYYTTEGENGPTKIDITEPGTLIFSQTNYMKNFLNKDDRQAEIADPAIYVPDNYAPNSYDQRFETRLYITSNETEELNQPVKPEYQGPKDEVILDTALDQYDLEERAKIPFIDLKNAPDQRHKFIEMAKILKTPLTPEAKLALEKELILTLTGDIVKHSEYFTLGNHMIEKHRDIFAEELENFTFSNESIIAMTRDPLFLKTVRSYLAEVDEIRLDNPTLEEVQKLLTSPLAYGKGTLIIENTDNQELINELKENDKLVISTRFYNPAVGMKFEGAYNNKIFTDGNVYNFQGTVIKPGNPELKYIDDGNDNQYIVKLAKSPSDLAEIFSKKTIDSVEYAVKNGLFDDLAFSDLTIDISKPQTVKITWSDILFGRKDIYGQGIEDNPLVNAHLLKIITNDPRFQNCHFLLSNQESTDEEISDLKESIKSENENAFEEHDSQEYFLQQSSEHTAKSEEANKSSTEEAYIHAMLAHEAAILAERSRSYAKSNETAARANEEKLKKITQHFDFEKWQATLLKDFNHEKFANSQFIVGDITTTRTEFLKEPKTYLTSQLPENLEDFHIEVQHLYLPKENIVKIQVTFEPLKK